MDKMKEEFFERLKKFIDDHGGIYAVAVKIDKSPQYFYSMFRRESMPGVDLMFLFMKNFDDFNLNFIMTGVESGEPIEVNRLRKELEYKEAIIRALVGK